MRVFLYESMLTALKSCARPDSSVGMHASLTQVQACLSWVLTMHAQHLVLPKQKGNRV